MEVTVVAPKLQDLNVSGCRTLGILSLQCPKLTRIRAAKCGALVLGVQHTLFECPSLEVLNIAGCRSLNAMCLEAILPSFAATVKEMDLSGCTGLSRVLIPEAAELQGVKVDGCSRLQRVAIGGSPKLTSFSAKGSELLQVNLNWHYRMVQRKCRGCIDSLIVEVLSMIVCTESRMMVIAGS